MNSSSFDPQPLPIKRNFSRTVVFNVTDKCDSNNNAAASFGIPSEPSSLSLSHIRPLSSLI